MIRIKRRKRRVGATTLEAILALPLLVVVTLGAFQMGMLLLEQQNLNAAAVQSVRLAQRANQRDVKNDTVIHVDAYYDEFIAIGQTGEAIGLHRPAIDITNDRVTTRTEATAARVPNMLYTFGWDTDNLQLGATATLPP